MENQVANTQPEEKKKRRWLLLLLLFLILVVVVTGIVWIVRLMRFLPDGDGAIDLTRQDSADPNGSGDGTENTDGGDLATNTFVANPSFEVEDAKQTWTKNTKVEIFRVTYEDGEEQITVESADGEKVIAPGTENSYTFKLKNTGNVAIKYTVSVDVVMTPRDAAIPVEARVRRFDGRWVLGGKESFESSEELNGFQDHYTLGANKYSYYTLDWRWIFEGVDDAHDTLLGNLGAEEPVSYLLVIRTYATEHEDPNADGGIIIPAGTSDNVDLIVWSLPAVVSLILLLFIPVWMRRKDTEESAE